ncbi:hypothetical protein JCM11251_002314 [Rhodosporidiobolus azoricus]
MPNIIHWIGAFCLFAAMALLVVASVSAPIWDTVGFLVGNINGQDFTFGNWGFCTETGCSAARLGYNRGVLEQITGLNGVGQTIVNNLSKTLILTPICAGLSAIALLFALGTSTALGIVASLLALLAFIATIVLLGLALGLFITARRRIRRLPNSDASLSTCIWLVVAAAALQLIAAFTVCFTRSRRRRAAREREFDNVPAMQAHPIRPSTSTEYAAPSTVGSTGPLMHESNIGTPVNGVPAVGEPVGPTTSSGKTGHFWSRKTATETY